jgi:hypothetical protein
MLLYSSVHKNETHVDTDGYFRNNFSQVCKIAIVESVTSILVVLYRMMPNEHYSSELNFSAYICVKVDHRFTVIFVRQIKVLT